MMAFKWKADLGRSFRFIVTLLVVETTMVTSFARGQQYYEIIRPVMPVAGVAPHENEVFPIMAEPQPAPVLASPIQIQPYGPIEEFQGPRKRSAIVIDKLMYALQKALDGKDKAPPRIDSYAAAPDLQRRTTGDTRLYWRCYFNAVSCF